MRRFCGVVVVLALASCATPGATLCGNGRTCPEDTVCDDIHQLCSSRLMAEVCEPLANGDRCEGERAGVCDQGFCIPACGDGVKDRDEECDDGNFASFDGCSSSCAVEARSWTQVPSPWQARTGHAASYDINRGRLVVFAGLDPSGAPSPLWEYDTQAARWEMMPTPPVPGRRFPMFAYDSSRGVHVLYGGQALDDTSFTDTWEYDGSIWTQKVPVTSPPLRVQAAMAYDPGRQRTILFGGIASGILLQDTWEWDGTSWTELTTSTLAPEGRTHASMAYDPARGVMVLTAGAYHCNTWELAGGQWTMKVIASPAAPSPTNQSYCRYGASIAYSAARQKLVLFGGFDNFVYYNDTWEYGATGWTRLAPTVAPDARRFAKLGAGGALGSLLLVGGATHDELYDDLWRFSSQGEWSRITPDVIPNPRVTMFVHDEARDRVILFGGEGAPLEVLRDTWAFDDGRWQRLATSGTEPPGARGSALAYDVKRDRVVMFGGTGSDETWEWDGSAWHEIATATKPAARRLPAMTYDRVRNVVVLFGGQNDARVMLADTWEYDGVNWTEITGAHPPPQDRTSMGFDRHAGRSILFSVDGSTWAYDGAWTQLAPTSSPVARLFAEVFWDPMRDRLALFGGNTASLSYSDLWEWTGETWEPLVIEGEPPPPRQAHHVLGLMSERAVLFFGGQRTAGGRFNDTWFLRYRSQSPEEICDNGIDDDGDLQIDAADPDCQ